MTDDEEVILLCCTGRSGSTTMMRILNTLPDSNICGENWGALTPLLQFWKSVNNIIDDPQHFGVSYTEMIVQEIKPCWYNSFDKEMVQTHLKTLIRSLFQKNNITSRVWGCKEIRYMMGEIELMPVMRELFPSLRVIVHLREDVHAQAKSGWWADQKNASEKLAVVNDKMRKFQEENPDFVYLSTFDTMLNLDSHRSLFAFLGHSEDFNEETVRTILDRKFE